MCSIKHTSFMLSSDKGPSANDFKKVTHEVL